MSRAPRAVLALFCLFAASASASAAGPEPLSGGPWPRTWTEGALTLSLFQPEVQRWEGETLSMRAAAQVKKGEKQTYGIVHLEARTETDQARKLVRLVGVKVTGTEFPSVPEKESHWQGLFGKHVAGSWELPLEKLEADAAIAEAERARVAVPPRNDPPVFLFRTTPAMLVLLDGEPSWRAVDGTRLERIVNTRPLVLRDPASGRVWLRLLDGWMTAPALDQQYEVAGGDQPAELAKALAWATTQPQVDLLDGKPPPDAAPPPDGKKPLPPPTLARGAPEIVVSKTPTELIITDGDPVLEIIPGTTLVSWKNTTSDVLVDVATNQLYVLVAGRWFSAATTAGPWTYVEPAALPSQFGKIPPGSAREAVLSSVPGTSQAREAAIANQVPQTATVKRSEARFTPTYDGEPKLEPIEGTALRYVLNASTPVIEVAPDQWYAVQNGVWFTSASAQGPWIAATFVPPAVYTIPATSPVHAVTYVRVYDATPEVIYVGYTPGYLGTYVGPGGLVYYGTGYPYRGWLGWSWWGPPVSYGYGVRIGWSSWGGWGLSMGWGWRPPGYGWGYGVSPYWGPSGYYRPSYQPAPYRGYGRPPAPAPYYRGGAYRSWGAAVTPMARPVPRPPAGYPRPPAGAPRQGSVLGRPGAPHPPPAARPGPPAPMQRPGAVPGHAPGGQRQAAPQAPARHSEPAPEPHRPPHQPR
jgi:hypothetical protein